MPEFTLEQKAEPSAYTRVHGNGEARVPDIRFADPPKPSFPTIRGPFHGIDLPKDTPAGAFVRNAVEANAANLEEKLRKHLAERDINRAVAMSAKYKSEVEYMERARKSEISTGTKHDADKPDAGTVLAGFWPAARLKLDLTDGFVVFREAGFSAGVLDRLFDTTVSISKRLTDALSLLQLSSLELAFRPGTFGARKKYGPDCWLRVTDGVNRYYQAAGRHAFKMLIGERVDSEGLVHSECLVWCIWAGATHVLRNEQERERE